MIIDYLAGLFVIGRIAIWLMCCMWVGSVAGQVWPGGQRLYVRGVVIEGNNVTQSSVITRELSIGAGSVVVSDSVDGYVLQNRLRLFNLQLFNEVEQEVVAVAADTVDWHIKVRERWYYIPKGVLQFVDRNINAWWANERHDWRRISAGLTVTDKNFRGALEHLSATVQLGYTQRLGLSYLVPYMDRRQRHGVGVMAYSAQSRQTWYETRANKLQFVGDYKGPVLWRHHEAGLFYTYRPGYAYRHVLLASVHDLRVGDTVVRLNADYLTDGAQRARYAELNYRLEYNGVDNWNYSLSGVKLVAQAVARVGWEGLHRQVYVQTEAGYFKHLGGRWYGSAIFRGRLMGPDRQPYYFRNGLGTQTDYVRGYEYYVTDGYSYGLGRVGLKYEAMNASWRLPFKYLSVMPMRVYPKVFIDAGQTRGNAVKDNTLTGSAMYSYGVGVDFVTFYDMKIRVEWAQNHLGQNGVYLHFNSE